MKPHVCWVLLVVLLFFIVDAQSAYSVVETFDTGTVYTVGGLFTYTISVHKRSGTATSVSATVTDTFPPEFTVQSITYSYTVSTPSPAPPPCNPTGNSFTCTFNLIHKRNGGDPPTNTLNIVAVGSILNNVTGSFENLASVTGPGPSTATGIATVSSSYLQLYFDVNIQKTFDVNNTYYFGNNVTFTINAQNIGPSYGYVNITDDWLSSGFVAGQWTAYNTGNSIYTSGTGNILTSQQINPYQNVSIILTAQLPQWNSSYNTTTAFSNTAQVNYYTQAPGIGFPIVHTATYPSSSVTTVVAYYISPGNSVNFTIQKSGPTTYTPGGSVTFTISLSNSISSHEPISNVTVTDYFEPNPDIISWGYSGCTNCVFLSAIDGIVAPSSDSFQVMVTASIKSDAVSFISNSASYAIPSSFNDSSTSYNATYEIDTPAPLGNITILKTLVNTGTIYAGESDVTYSIVVTNNGPSQMRVVVVDYFTTPFATNSTAWYCIEGIGCSCEGYYSGSDDITNSILLDLNGQVAFNTTGTLYDLQATNITNTVYVVPIAGYTLTGSNTTTLSSLLQSKINLTLSKDSAAPYNAGDYVTFTLSVMNNGPTQVPLLITDTWLGTFNESSSTGWQCASCVPSLGNGNINNVALDAVVGQLYNLVLTAQIYPSTAAGSFLTNTFTVNTTQSRVTNIGQTQATKTIGPVILDANINILKYLGSSSTFVPGNAITYLIRVSYLAGTSDAPAEVVDTISELPLISAQWLCNPSYLCTPNTFTSGDINKNLTIGVGQTVTFTITGQIPSSISVPARLANTAYLTATANPGEKYSNSSTEPTAVQFVTDLSITKTASASTVYSGNEITWAIKVTNNGPSDTPPFPDGEISIVDNWLSSEFSGGSWISTTGDNGTNTNILSTRYGLVVGDSIDVTLVVTTIPSSQIYQVSNAAQVSIAASADVTDLNSTNNADSSSVNLYRAANITLNKQVISPLPAVPGLSVITYEITVSNYGPSWVTSLAVFDHWSTYITSDGVGNDWTTAATSPYGGCSPNTGNGDVSINCTIPSNSQIKIDVKGSLLSSVSSAFTNNASVSGGYAVFTSNVTKTTYTFPINNLLFESDMEVQKGSPWTNATAGLPYEYTILVINHGPSDVVGVSVVDLWTSVFNSGAGHGWKCTLTGSGSGCPGGLQTGNINFAANLVVGSSISIALTVGLKSSAVYINNTAYSYLPATVTDLGVYPNNATDSRIARILSDLAINKTNSKSRVVPGSTESYSITVTNNGPSDTAFTVFDWCDDFFTGPATVSCGGCGSVPGVYSIPVEFSDSLVAGASRVYTISIPLNSSALGSFTNHANVTIHSPGSDPVLTNNVASDTDTFAPVVDVSITKTDSQSTIIAGTFGTYVITAYNNGPSDAPSLVASIIDYFPSSAFSDVYWKCAPAAYCNPTFGFGDVYMLPVLPAGASLDITATVQYHASLIAGTSFTNYASIGLYNQNTYAIKYATTNTTNDISSDTDVVGTRTDLSITKRGDLEVVSGGNATYTIVVTNEGPSDSPATTIIDNFPGVAGTFSWDCYPSLGAYSTDCYGSSSTLPFSVTAQIAAFGDITYVITTPISTTVAAQSSSNTASVSVTAPLIDTNSSNDQSTWDFTFTKQSDLSISKTDNSLVALSGIPNTYSITVFNNGPSDLASPLIEVTDYIDTTFFGSAYTLSCPTCVQVATGNPNLITVTLGLNVGASEVIILTLNVLPSVPQGNVISNQANVSAMLPASDPFDSNNQDVDTSTITAGSDVVLTKYGFSSPIIGHPLTYSIIVQNNGPADATTTSIVDVLPPIDQFDNIQWYCLPSATVTCFSTTPQNVTGPQLVDSPAIPNGGALTYVIIGDVPPSASGTIINSAAITIYSSSLDPNTTNNADQVTGTLTFVADVAITKTATPQTFSGEDITYLVVVTNNGPSDTEIGGFLVSDTFSSTYFSYVSWNCTGGPSTSCTSGSGFSISDNAFIPAGEAITYYITGNTQSTVPSNTIVVNDASVGLTYDPNTANNKAEANTTVLRQALFFVNISQTYEYTAGDYYPGTFITYTLTVTNEGPSSSTANEIDLISNFPADLTVINWNCTSTTGSSCGGSTGSSSFSLKPVLIKGGELQFTIIGSTTPSVSVPILKTGASLTLSDPTLDPYSRSSISTEIDDNRLQITDLTISAVSNPYPDLSYGESVTLTISVSNSGPSLAKDWTGASSQGVQLSTPFPPEFDLYSMYWNCSSYRAVCQTGVSSTPPTETMNLVTTPNPDAIGKSSSKTLIFNFAPLLTLNVSKTDGLQYSTPPPYSVTYTIIISNSGPSDADGLSVSDLMNPNYFSDFEWECTCGSSGGGSDINDVIDIQSGKSVSYTITATYASIVTIDTVIHNDVNLELPSGYPNPSAFASDSTQVANGIDIQITNVVITPSVYVPDTGESILYDFILFNNGPAGLTDGILTVNWRSLSTSFIEGSCVDSTGGAVCVSPSIDPDEFTMTDIVIPLLGTLEIQITVIPNSQVSQPSLTATLSFQPGPNQQQLTELDPSNNVVNVFTPITPQVDDFVKLNVSAVSPLQNGDTVVYTAYVCNQGLSTSHAIFTEPLDLNVFKRIATNWTCTATGNADCYLTEGFGSGPLDQLTLTGDPSCNNHVVFVTSGVIQCGINTNYKNGIYSINATVSSANENDTNPNNNWATASIQLPINQPPVITSPTTTTFTGIMNTNISLYNFAGENPDDPSQANPAIFYLVVGKGVLFIDSENINLANALIIGDGTKNLTIDTQIIHATPILQYGIVYTPPTDFTGNVDLVVTMNDLGFGGCDGPKEGKEKFIISISSTCPPNLPILCDTNICVATKAECCPLILCPDGTCVASDSQCCGRNLVRCPGINQKCVASLDLCNATCAAGLFLCCGGQCASSSADCCACSTPYRCPDTGTCVKSASSCAASCPFKCASTGKCVQSESDCSTSGCSGGQTYCSTLGQCISLNSKCPISSSTSFGGGSVAFSQGTVELNAVGFSLNVSTGTILEFNTRRQVVQAQNTADPRLVYTGVQKITTNADGDTVTNVNFTTTLFNGAFLVISTFITTTPTTNNFGGNDLANSGGSTKLGVSLYNWPFLSYANTLQISLNFDLGGTVSDGQCIGGHLYNAGDLRASIEVVTADGVTVSVSLLQYAILDGKKHDVKASLNSTVILIETDSFHESFVYDPDFSVLLGGGSSSSSSNGCTGTAYNDALLYASISVLVFSACVVFLFIIFVLLRDYKKKSKKAKARKMREAAYNSALRNQDSHASMNGGTWGSSSG